MVVPALFFLFAFITLVALMWSGYELFRDQEDPLGDRLEELQAHAIVSSHRTPRPKEEADSSTPSYISSACSRAAKTG